MLMPASGLLTSELGAQLSMNYLSSANEVTCLRQRLFT